MAVAYQYLNVTKRGYVSIANPDTHYNVSPTSSYAIRYKPLDQKSYMFFGIESFPTALRRKKITEIQVTARAQQSEDRYLSPDIYVYASKADFNANTITWNTMPSLPSSTQYIFGSGDLGTGWQNVTAKSKSDTAGTDHLERVIGMLHTHAFLIGNTGSWYDSYNLIPAADASGSNRMVRVTYDPDVNVVGKVVMKTKPSYGQMPTKEATFVWVHEASGGRCPDEYCTQVSAVFKYKVSTASEWTSVNISGDTKTYSIPANTLPTASTINWEPTTTDEDGTESSTSGSFTTCTPVLTLTSYPSGSNYDTRNTTLLEWTLKYNSEDYPQSSASFFWRKQNDENWTEISQSGNNRQLVVPANTFPTAATIQFYLATTDSGGHTAQTAVRTFTTVSTSIVATVFPTGNNNNPSIPILFEWKYNCAFEDYDQSTATLQWRRSDVPNWTDIVITGNVKSFQVPANTFATSATIQWRIIGTDSGGHVSQTNVATFNTLSTQITQQGGPTSGYCDPRNPITFSWYYPCAVGDYSQQSAVFHWKLSTDEEWTDITISGNTKSLTIPANTFPVASLIQWYIEGTDMGGTTSQTEEFEFSTTAETAYAYCIAPVGRVVDGTKEIIFEWVTTNADGSDPTRTIILWKYDTEGSSSWKTLLDTTDVITSYAVEAETFEAGTIEWKVSAYNRDSIQGPENQASFVCLIAPDAPAGLSATPVPRTTVRWQGSGQEAYEVSIDGVIVKKEYGPGVYSYQQMEPLEDGIHTITVRVQGSYGLWSNPSTTTINVINDPDVEIALSGAFGLDGTLSWEYSEAVNNADIQIYRDGKRIADVGDAVTFIDRFVLGEHSYYVELWQEDGSYSRSNTVTGVMDTERSMISEVSVWEWLSLRLTENSDSVQNFTWTRTSVFQHVLGSPFPVIELGISEDLIGTYDCAFRTVEEVRAFEALKGKTVILKSRGGNVVIGALVALNKQVKDFYTTFTFSLQQIHWEDFISYD